MFGAIMGCFCSKGVSAHESNKSEKRLFGTLTSDDVVVEFSEESDMQLAQRNNKIDIVGNVGVYQEGMSYNDDCLFGDTESLLLKPLRVSEFQKKQMSVRFEEKPQSEQEEILVYLYLNWGDLQQDSSVIEALEGTKFVTSVGGELYKPKDLFDPADALLTSLFSGEANKFPGERFVSDGWLSILRKTGLQNTSDADTLLKCARKVEFLGAESMSNTTSLSEVSLEIFSLAETLLSAMFDNFEVFNGDSFFNILGNIACIPAEKGFLSESGKKDVKRAICSYSEAILLKDWPLSWCNAPIISRVPPEYSWGALQLRSPPPFRTVLKHLQDEGWIVNSRVVTIEEASFQVLKYLDTIWGTLSSSDILELQQVAFIAADNGTQVVTSGSLFVHLTINIFPLASKLPSRYLPFVKILKEMGVEDTLSISCALNLLSRLRKSCGYHSLNPNELHAVIELLHFLRNETVKKREADIFYWESQLVVPDDTCSLVHPKSCVYIDHYGSQYVKFIDTSKLRFVHHDVTETLCLAFGIRKLSDIVVEELHNAECLQTIDEIGSISLASIRLKLLSRPFQVAVLSVVNDFYNITSGSKSLDFQTLQISLKSVAQRLQFVQHIYTRFWHLPKNLDVTRTSKHSIFPGWESGSSHRALHYVNCSNTCMLIAKPPSYMSVIDVVAIVVSNVLGSQIPLPIGSLFLCPQDSETAISDILKLSSAERVMDRVGRGTYFLGRDIHPGDANKVLLDPTRPHYKGEIVAWKRKNAEMLKYGRIPEDVRPSPEQTVYTLKLETSPGKTETIISSHVFLFINFKVCCNISKYMMPKEDMHVEKSVESRRVKLRNQRRATKEFEHGRVSAEEFVKAVDEIFSGAGINLDTENQCLIQTTLSLQERLNESQEALVFEQENLKTATEDADTAKAALQCRICMTNEIEITLVPCGHVICRSCSSDVFFCPICRGQISKTMKIYQP